MAFFEDVGHGQGVLYGISPDRCFSVALCYLAPCEQSVLATVATGSRLRRQLCRFGDRQGPFLGLSGARKLPMTPICSELVRDLRVAGVSYAALHSQRRHRVAERRGRCSSRRPERRHERATRSTKRVVVSVNCSTAQSVTEHPPTGVFQ